MFSDIRANVTLNSTRTIFYSADLSAKRDVSSHVLVKITKLLVN